MADPATPLPRVPSTTPARPIVWPEVAYPVWPEDRSRWFLPDLHEPFPLDTFLIQLQRYLLAVFRILFDEQGRDWFASYEQKMLLDEFDLRLGLFPDFYVLPCQPNEPHFDQWPAYLPDVPGPIFGLEVVSRSNWEKDYQEAPGKYAMLGAQELVIFDPMAREGKSPANPAYAMQVYRGGEKGGMRRVYAGQGPVYSEVMGVWLHPEERGLLVTRDEAGKEPVATREEAEGWWRELRKAREEQRKAEEKRRATEAQRRAAEAQRRAAEERGRTAEEQRRLAEEQRRLAEERERAAEEQRRLAEEQRRLAEEQRRLAEERERAAEEQRCLAEERERAAEEQRRTAEEQRRAAEAQAMADAREALVDLCDALAIDLTPERQAHLASLDLPALRSLRALLKQARRWPD